MIHPTPSQAEGDREAIEEDLRQKEGQGGQEGYASAAGLDSDDVTYTPSQAEGDRDTVDADLEDKGL